MTCPKCGVPIPEGKLGCVSCLEKRAWSDARAMAARSVPAIATGRVELRLIRKSKHSVPVHIGLPNFWGSYCAADLRDYHNVNKPELKTLQNTRVYAGICLKCITAIDDLIRQAKVA